MDISSLSEFAFGEEGKGPPKKKQKTAKKSGGGSTKKEKKAAKASDAGSGDSDPLQLKPLFEGGETWYPLLKSTIERQKDAAKFIGPSRDKSIVPVRQLTFQALKPNPPEKWKVVIFGQSPYPRLESATGIAMFDNTFHQWKMKRFGQVTSMRCIIKSALGWKFKTPRSTPVKDMRVILRREKIVEPPEWFTSILAQGCLLLNAALTASNDKSLYVGAHAKFWEPVVHRIVEEILRAKQKAEDPQCKGLVFAWWGTKALRIRKQIDSMLTSVYKDVPVRHVIHCNPAAMGDAFCSGNHFGDVNMRLEALGMKPIDWLPAKGWDAGLSEEKEGLCRRAHTNDSMI